MSYIGGKHRLAKRLIAMFPPHTTYCEVFLGGAQVLPQGTAVQGRSLNDLDGQVVNSSVAPNSIRRN